MASTSLREFLMTRRARIDPASAGLPQSPTPRRRSGLRREEVAALAGVSVDYYAQLEQGRVGKVSDQVLMAIADALALDALERSHLRALADGGRSAPAPVMPSASVRPGLRAMLDALDPTPALLQDHRLDVHYANRAARRLFTDFETMPHGERNIARWLFLAPEARERYPQWEQVAALTVGALRAVHNPGVTDTILARLVERLLAESPEFRRLWADYELFKHSHGLKEIWHPDVGVMTLNYETLEVSDSDGQQLCIYSAESGSVSADRLAAVVAM